VLACRLGGVLQGEATDPADAGIGRRESSWLAPGLADDPLAGSRPTIADPEGFMTCGTLSGNGQRGGVEKVPYVMPGGFPWSEQEAWDRELATQ